jgi:hypothetical protein
VSSKKIKKMRVICYAFLMLLVCHTSFSQTKKEQIEILILQKDSLIKVLDKERQLNSKKVNELEVKISSEKESFDQELEKLKFKVACI